MSAELGQLAGLRVGFGLSALSLDAGAPLALGGMDMAGGTQPRDPVCEALLDALLSACGLPGTEALIAPEDAGLANPEAYVMLSQIVAVLKRKRLRGVLNASVQLAGPAALQLPDLPELVGSLAAALQITPTQLSVNSGARGIAGALLKPDTLLVTASLLCAVQTAQAVLPAAARQRLAPAQGRLGLHAETDAPPEEELVNDLPKRARSFEKAVRSKLPPLPPAPPPRPGDSLVVYTDGASRGNPGPAATGWVVLDSQGRLVGEGGTQLGERTNNQAEYEAVLEAAGWIEQSLGRDYHLLIRSDSELLVRQLRGEWKVKDEELQQLVLQAMSQLMYFATFELNWVSRKENSRADALCNRVLDGKPPGPD